MADVLPMRSKLIHRQHVLVAGAGGAVVRGPLVNYYRAGKFWEVFWRRDDGPGGELIGGFASMADARRDAEKVLGCVRPA